MPKSVATNDFVIGSAEGVEEMWLIF